MALAPAKIKISNNIPITDNYASEIDINQITKCELITFIGIITAEKSDLRLASISATHMSKEPEDQIMKLLDENEALEDEIINSLIKSLKIPLSNLQNPSSQKELFFPSRIISLVAKQMWKYGFIKESERLFAIVIETIQEQVMNFEGDDVILPGAYWFSNVHELFSFVNAAKNDILRGVDLESDSKYNTYHIWMKELKKLLFKVVIPVVIEGQLFPGFITSEKDLTFNMDDLLNFLNKVWEAMKLYYVEMPVILHVLTELFKIVGTISFNDLLMVNEVRVLKEALKIIDHSDKYNNYRRNFCSWKRAFQIQYNIIKIEEWCKNHEMTDCMLQLERLSHATKLLQFKKSTLGDIEIIYDVCLLLTSSQIQKFIMHYFLANYEDSISPEILKIVASRVNANDKKDILFLDTTPLEDSGPFEVPLPREVNPFDNYIPAWLDLPHIRRLLALSP
ncbi:18553_t:CDS:10 [Gigaspora margarita]|uniref:18553_t:CDS:1 n=1 Tax=Gigaspora margarita TaxID=4874 RepID=A0ABM8W0J9_GIGMA|nr:18553_t:CDS:10 [Gigaspora margarita]